MVDEETPPPPTLVEEPTTPPTADAVSSGEPKQEASPALTEPESVQNVPEPQTAQIPLSEPLAPEPEPISPEPPGQATKSADSPVDEPLPPEPEPLPPEPEPIPATTASAPSSSEPTASAPIASAPITTGNSRDMFVKARAVIQVRKHEKLDKIMEALNIKDPTTLKLRRAGEITNDEVEKLLHVSDATATRYLSALEKEGKIKQVGKTGMGVVYTKV